LPQVCPFSKTSYQHPSTIPSEDPPVYSSQRVKFQLQWQPPIAGAVFKIYFEDAYTCHSWADLILGPGI
jgi:hypothetical protein